MSKTFRSRSSDHVPVVPTMVSSGTVGVKRIHVFRNADQFFQGIQVVVNTHRVPSIDVLLDVVSERIGLVNGAKKLYTTGGTLIKDINKIRDGQSYVASSSHFTPMGYGGQREVEEKKKSKKKKKVRSKTVHSVERKKHEERELEVVIPWNEEPKNEHHHEENAKKKKKKVVKKKKEKEHHGSIETLAETAEVELPSEIEDSEVEEHHSHHHEHRKDHDEEDTHSRGRSTLQSPEPSRPSTAFRHNTDPPRSTSRRGSRKEVIEKEEKKKSVRRKSQPNWGDLSSFTKNIESLLKN